MILIKTKYDRRSFLKVSAAAGGGMVIGFSWLASCAPNAEQLTQLPEEWFDINAFLKIGDNGVVTIMAPNPEIGQNVKTSMPMIVAEELDVDWKNVIVEQAGLDTDKYTRQLAGGSQSIRQGWKSLRMAGATARRMLLEAAAKANNVPVGELTTEGGIIHHKASGRSWGYGEMASLGADVEVPEKVDLKKPKDFRIIGHPTKNVDGKNIVTGKPLFGLDYHEDGMLIAMIVHPPAFGMKLGSYNDSKARSMPGIKDVIRINSLPEGLEKQWSDVNAFPELVAVVGNTTWEVMQAKKALDIQWEQVSDRESTKGYAEALTKLLTKSQNPPERRDGNPEATFKSADQVIERSYSAPFLAHNTMEPMNFFAHVTSTKAELVGPVQTPEYLRKTAARVLDLPEDKVSIMLTRMGGGFGRRLYGHFGIEAALISKQMNAPVKLVYTREDDMSQGTYRPAYKVTYRAAISKDKELLAFHVKGAGIHGSPVFSNRYPAGTVDHYLAENFDLDSNISTGAWRAPRSNFMAFAEQSFLDELAEACEKDPIDFRLQLFDRAIKDPVGEKNDYDASRYEGVLKLVREKSGWDENMPGLSRGVSAYYCHNSYIAQVVDIAMVKNQPKIQKIWCAVDCGIVVNPEGAINEIEGGMIDGIGHAMYSALTFKDGAPQQHNFDTYRLIRHSEAPTEIEVFFVKNEIDPTGLGEPSLPPISAALANALVKATGKRYYDQPFIDNEAGFGMRKAI